MSLMHRMMTMHLHRPFHLLPRFTFCFAFLLFCTTVCVHGAVLRGNSGVEIADAELEATKYPWQNWTLPLSDRISSLLSALSLSEKLGLLSSQNRAIERLNISAFNWGNECLHGVMGKDGETSTVFPQPLSLSSTYNPSLLHRISLSISTEARALRNKGHTGEYLSCWAPNMNIYRDPRWGRGSETYGEDPFLTSVMLSAYIDGLQQKNVTPYLKVSATCKHFLAYSLEEANGISRFYQNVEIDPIDLADMYLPAFEACVESSVESIMCAYPSLNGTPMCADERMINGQLRGDWKWNGLVVSDCGAVENIYTQHRYTHTEVEAVAKAINAGTDVDCGDAYNNALKEAVLSGLVDEESLSLSLSRVLSTRFRLGEFDPASLNVYTNISPDVIGSDEHMQLAKEAAIQGTVLLKNDFDILPLNLSALSNVAVIGPTAIDTDILLGNYHGPPFGTPKTPLEALQERFGEYNITTVGSQGCWVTGEGTWKFPDAIKAVREADIGIVFLGSRSSRSNLTFSPSLLSTATEKESLDRQSLLLPGVQEDLLKALASQTDTPLILVLIHGGEIDIGWAQRSTRIGAILSMGYPGQRGGEALVDILDGSSAPSGRTSVSWYYNSYAASISPTDMHIANHTYRWLENSEKRVLFPFGYGLSYSTLKWKINAAEVVEGDAGGHLQYNIASNFSGVNVQFSLGNIGPKTVNISSLAFIRYIDDAIITHSNPGGLRYIAPKLLHDKYEHIEAIPIPFRSLGGFLWTCNIFPEAVVDEEIFIARDRFMVATKEGERIYLPGRWEICIEDQCVEIELPQ